jgi:hypothetical protein
MVVTCEKMRTKVKFSPEIQGAIQDIDLKLPEVAPFLTDPPVNWKRSCTDDDTYQLRPPPEPEPTILKTREFSAYMAQAVGDTWNREFSAWDFKRYYTPHVINYLLTNPLREHPKSTPLNITVLCHGDLFYLEYAVLLYLVSTGYIINAVNTYDPSCNPEVLYDEISGCRVTDTGLSRRIHFFNHDNYTQFRQAVQANPATFIFGLNCQIPPEGAALVHSIPTINTPDGTDRNFRSLLRLTDQYAFLVDVLGKSRDTPNYNFVCDTQGYYGTMRRPEINGLQNTLTGRCTPALKLTNRLFNRTPGTVPVGIEFPLNPPEGIDDINHPTHQSYLNLFKNPILRLGKVIIESVGATTGDVLQRISRDRPWLKEWFLTYIQYDH